MTAISPEDAFPDRPTLHLLGLPHTITRDEYSHCAFTGKVQRFSPMLRAQGYRVLHYGVAGAESGATEDVDLMSNAEWEDLKALTRTSANLPTPDDRSFVGDLANVGNILYKTFNARAAAAIRERLSPRDLVCLPFGHAHQDVITLLGAMKDCPPFETCETGIGYPTTFVRHLVFESYAWMHWHLGKRHENVRSQGVDYHWVVPNYFDASAWDASLAPEKDLVVYFGRIYDNKGLPVVVEIAKRRPDLRFLLCGQGDPEPWTSQSSNLEYLPPVHGHARSDLLGRALAVVMPTRFIEPFGGVTVEANLCGTPVLGAGCGSFTETIRHGVTGYQCRTLGDFLAGLERIEDGAIDRKTCRAHGETYDLSAVGPRYDAVVRQIHDLWGLHGDGWFAHRSAIGPVTRATEPTAPHDQSGLVTYDLKSAYPTELEKPTPVFGSLLPDKAPEKYTNQGKWDGAYADLKTPAPYGDVATYVLGERFLRGLSVEDWGCGRGFFSTLIPKEKYRGVDGSRTPFADEIADLRTYRSQAEAVFVRHVLEHDYGWREIFDNVLASFQKRAVVVLFTPTGEETREIAFHESIGVPDLSFSLQDLRARVPAGVTWETEKITSATQYGTETVIYLERA